MNNRDRVVKLLNSKGMFADQKKIQYHLEKLLNTSLDGKIEFFASLARLDRLASLDSLASLASLARLDRLDRLASLARLDRLDRLARLDRLDRLARLASLDSLASLASLARLARLASLDSLDSLDRLASLASLDIDYESGFSYSANTEISKRWQPFLCACESGLFQCWFYKSVIYVLVFPTTINRDNNHRLHAENIHAVEWLGEKLYYWHGVKVSDKAILQPGQLTIKDIQSEKNQEVKRALIECMGVEKYLHESKAKPIHTDSFGRLFKFEGEKYYIELTNPTPNHDGSKRLYYMPINPYKYNGDAGRIAKAAVASTWRNPLDTDQLIFADWRDYNPDYAA